MGELACVFDLLNEGIREKVAWEEKASCSSQGETGGNQADRPSSLRSREPDGGDLGGGVDKAIGDASQQLADEQPGE